MNTCNINISLNFDELNNLYDLIIAKEMQISDHIDFLTKGGASAKRIKSYTDRLHIFESIHEKLAISKNQNK